MFFALGIQAAMISMLALLLWGWWEWDTALGFCYGGGVALASSGLLVWRWHRGLHDYHCDGGRHLRSFHRSSLERFFVVGVLLAAGLAGLRLAPLPMLLGLIVGQFAWVLALAALKTE